MGRGGSKNFVTWRNDLICLKYVLWVLHCALTDLACWLEFVAERDRVYRSFISFPWEDFNGPLCFLIRHISPFVCYIYLSWLEALGREGRRRERGGRGKGEGGRRRWVSVGREGRRERGEERGGRATVDWLWQPESQAYSVTYLPDMWYVHITWLTAEVQVSYTRNTWPTHWCLHLLCCTCVLSMIYPYTLTFRKEAYPHICSGKPATS